MPPLGRNIVPQKLKSPCISELQFLIGKGLSSKVQTKSFQSLEAVLPKFRSCPSKVQKLAFQSSEAGLPIGGNRASNRRKQTIQ
jgi:hypothetical protein